MKKQIVLGLIIFVSALIGFVAGMYFDKSGDKATSGVEIKNLKSKDVKERQEYVDSALESYEKKVSDFIRLASEEVEPLPINDLRYPWRDSKHLAILHLGDVRGSAAVQVLLDNLEYRNARDRGGSYLDVGGWYPAGEALAKIGMPAVKPVIDKLSTYSGDSKGSEICCWILTKVLGAELAGQRVNIEIRRIRDETAKQNLKAALKYLENTKEEGMY